MMGRTSRFASLFIPILVGIITACVPSAAFADPPVSPVLLNCGFEDIHGVEGHSIYPWVQYTVEEGSGYHPIDGLVGPYPSGGLDYWDQGVHVKAYEGSYFVGAAATGAYKNGGVYQRVAVNPGDLYTLTVHYLTYQAGGGLGDTKVCIGIDPTGGTNPRSTHIQWWSGYSFTNDNGWHSAAVTVCAGESEVATVFLEFQQKFAILWHTTAVDGVTFCTPLPNSIGALKASMSNLGAVLENKIVTYAYPGQIWVKDGYYRKVYIQESNRTAGIAVLFPPGGYDYPLMGNKLTVTGALGLYDGEAAVRALSWTVVDHNVNALPKPVAMPQMSVGKSSPNQPAILGQSAGVCNVGLRIRVFGKVTWTNHEGPGDATAYIDDGSGMQDATAHAGLRVDLMGKELTGISPDNYIAVTGVLAVLYVDPNGWPGTGDEYYTYTVLNGSPDDWDIL